MTHTHIAQARSYRDWLDFSRNGFLVFFWKFQNNKSVYCTSRDLESDEKCFKKRIIITIHQQREKEYVYMGSNRFFNFFFTVFFFFCVCLLYLAAGSAKRPIGEILMERRQFFIAGRSSSSTCLIRTEGRNMRFYRVKGTRFVRVYNIKIDEGPTKRRRGTSCLAGRLLTFPFARIFFDVHKEKEEIKKKNTHTKK